MKRFTISWALLGVCFLGTPAIVCAQEKRELKVHVAQANNDSPYVFVRTTFDPGWVADPWGVRFFDDKGKEIPFFVWDAITWGEAMDGKDEWGKRYAVINHGPGNAPEVLEARDKKFQALEKSQGFIVTILSMADLSAKMHPDSICAAVYLLQHRTPAYGKERLTLRIDPENKIQPKRRVLKGDKVGERVTVKQGDLEFRGLPDRLTVAWKGKEVMRNAGFDAGGRADSVSHADPTRPYAVESVEGIITRVSIKSHTAGRKDGLMDWRCTYWLFPEGCFVGLEGFSLSDTTEYPGGPQKLSVWQADGNFTEKHGPSWDTPWWLHQAGEGGFVASHLFYATPLATGMCNNPFTVNSEGGDKDPRADANANRLTLSWSHRVDDPAIMRIMTPQQLPRPGDPKPKGKQVAWQPKVDWLYRQYVVGVSEQGPLAEKALRNVLGAAAGWIDHKIGEEFIAKLLVDMMPTIGKRGETAEIGLLKVVPAVLKDDPAAIREALSKAKDQAARTDYYINLIKRHVELGGKPAEGKKKDAPDGTPREGWTGNPCYHAALMPCYIRVLEHFELPFREQEYRQAVVRYADFTLDLLAGRPNDFDKMNTVCQAEWPSRIVPIIPLMLHANTLKKDERYGRTARMIFQDLMRLVERNPHGYFPAWSFNPKADKFDTVYNPVSYERGLAAPWSEDLLDLVGREEAHRLVTSQARWLVFSGQLTDTLETDNLTAIRAATHGAHTNIRNQIGIYLYDDFDFYRGLLANLVIWSAASSQVAGPFDPTGTSPYRSLELSNGGSSMLRWALGIKPGSKWLESKVETGKNSFRLQAWNRKPLAKPMLKVSAKEVALKGDAEVLTVQLDGPAYRLPADFEVSWKDDSVTIRISRAAKIRLVYDAVHPGWAKEKLDLRRRDGDTTQSVGSDVAWEANAVQWRGEPGEYSLVIRK
jgi:hypothetical protein